MNKYKILYGDPPWLYGNFSNAGPSIAYISEGKTLRHESKYGITPYDGMPIEEIKKLPIENMAEDDSVLFLWVTYPCLQWGMDVIKAWGFEYKTVAFTWVKKNRNGVGWYLGLGNYTRANAEICMLATKGKGLKVQNKTVRQICDLPLTKHSQKPNEIRNRIIKLFGDLPRIELFARTKIHGWDTWGNDHKLELEPLENYLKKND